MRKSIYNKEKHFLFKTQGILINTAGNIQLLTTLTHGMMVRNAKRCYKQETPENKVYFSAFSFLSELTFL